MTEIGFAERAKQLTAQHMALLIEYLESRPIGSFVSREQVDMASGGVRLDLRELQEAMRQSDSSHGFWSLMKDRRFVGLFVISAQALRAYDNYPV